MAAFPPPLPPQPQSGLPRVPVRPGRGRLSLMATCKCCEPSAAYCSGYSRRERGREGQTDTSARRGSSSSATARLREQLRQGEARAAEQRLKAREDLRIEQQQASLRAQRKQQTQARILARARSLPVLESTSKPSLAQELRCEGCAAFLSARLSSSASDVSSFYVCQDCICDAGIRVCLCPACHDMKELVHEEGPEHSFLHSDHFTAFPSSDETSVSRWLKIDFHQHCHHEDESGLEELLHVNSEWNVEQCVLLALRPLIGSTRQEVMRRNDWVLQAAARHSQIIPFVTVIEDDPMAPRMFSECLDRGARGLKLIGWHSSFIEKHDYDLQHPALLNIYRIAASRGVPVLAHIYIGSSGRRDYVHDLDVILSANPKMKFVMAHFGLGFDDAHWPSVTSLAEKHSNLYFDTSFYGGYKEVWFSRASGRASQLRNFVLRFPRRVLFGSDVFADSRTAGSCEYHQALRASMSFVQSASFACLEFQRTDYFSTIERDAWGPVKFDPLRLQGLDLASQDPVVLRRCI
eukprot:TRINITY_DN33877_c0_g1_i1.p1 TRINITY_DN33877_c0_g1~~TRINITY_DN33877_c0_g1_i1.p1  ORF type:complete len:534 (+),score=99.05 TRINITY_DN33877_c0_g1_i1:41-1603(+)